VVSSPYYDNPYWEHHLPINPPIQPGTDLDIFTGGIYVHLGPVVLDLPNWLAPSGEYTFEPRLKENVQQP
jgi:hypothetical protein